MKARFYVIFTKNPYFNAFSIEIQRKQGQKHISRSPDMFPRVPQLEIAYLAPSNYPNDMMEKSQGSFLFDIKCYFVYRTC